jgi:hypothetical protein
VSIARFYQGKPKRGAAAEARPAERRETRVGRVFRCRRCRQPISSPAAAFCMGSHHPTQVFLNPAGYAHEVLTVRAAENLRLEPQGTAEATWFPGYAWRIAYCGRCGVHLGWRYDAVAGGEPARFFGLITRAIVEDDSDA